MLTKTFPMVGLMYIKIHVSSCILYLVTNHCQLTFIKTANQEILQTWWYLEQERSMFLVQKSLENDVLLCLLFIIMKICLCLWHRNHLIQASSSMYQLLNSIV